MRCHAEMHRWVSVRILWPKFKMINDAHGIDAVAWSMMCRIQSIWFDSRHAEMTFRKRGTNSPKCLNVARMSQFKYLSYDRLSGLQQLCGIWHIFWYFLIFCRTTDFRIKKKFLRLLIHRFWWNWGCHHLEGMSERVVLRRVALYNCKPHGTHRTQLEK